MTDYSFSSNLVHCLMCLMALYWLRTTLMMSPTFADTVLRAFRTIFQMFQKIAQSTVISYFSWRFCHQSLRSI